LVAFSCIRESNIYVSVETMEASNNGCSKYNSERGGGEKQG